MYLLNLLLLFSLPFFLTGEQPRKQQNLFVAHRVAHAGGGIDGQVGLNSIGALDVNLERGFQYFELDLVLTKDLKVVCLRNWNSDFYTAFGYYPSDRLAQAEFKELIEALPERWARCEQDSLLSWVEDNPNARIITDFKESNIIGLMVMSEVFPKKSVIPQIYTMNNYQIVRGLGFDQIILTLYRSNLSDFEILEQLREFRDVSAVTMPEIRASGVLPKKLSEIGIPTYVHTVNSMSDFKGYRENWVTEIYTDYLYPDSFNR